VGSSLVPVILAVDSFVGRLALRPLVLAVYARHGARTGQYVMEESR
jgi:hypothetical protein